MRAQALPFPIPAEAGAHRPGRAQVAGGRRRSRRPPDDPARLLRLESEIRRLLAASDRREATGRAPARWLRGLETLQACISVTADRRLRQALVIEAERLLASLGGGSAVRARAARDRRTSRDG